LIWIYWYTVIYLCTYIYMYAYIFGLGNFLREYMLWMLVHGVRQKLTQSFTSVKVYSHRSPHDNYITSFAHKLSSHTFAARAQPGTHIPSIYVSISGVGSKFSVYFLKC
jgi:hypothetical protein